MYTMFQRASAVSVAFAAGFAGIASADSIAPTSDSLSLALGEHETVRHTVVVEAAGTTTALIDVAFLIDTSGSMGDEIDAAKDAAGDIISALQSFGNAAASVGVFSEGAFLPADRAAPGSVLNQDITTDPAEITAAINDVTLGVPDFGGSFPESSNTAIDLVAKNASWRPGSNRFIFAFGDASSNDFVSDDDVIASLAAENIDLYGLAFSSSFREPISSLGGTFITSRAQTDELVEDITSGLTAGFADYDAVSIDDLDSGLPEIGVAVSCVSADTGTCVGDTATGDYDRSVDRTFEFDVTYTRLAAGDTTFDVHALVDGGIVATEVVSATTPPSGGGGMGVIPLPATAWLMLGGIAGLGALRNRRK